MASPNKLHFDRSLEIGCGFIESKCSKTGKIWTLRVQPPLDIKGPPGDFASLSGSNEQNLDTPNIHRFEFIRNETTLLIWFEGVILNNVFFPNTPDADAKQELLEFFGVYRIRGALSSWHGSFSLVC